MVLNYQDILSYFDNDTLRTDVFINKYALIENNLAETPAQMFHRLANELHRIENYYQNPLSYDYIHYLLADFKYLILGGSSMYGIGNNESYTSLSNCFYIGNNGVDSYGSIMKMDEQLVQLMKRRGGVGIDISHLRPKGAKVTNAAKTSSGAVSFMNRFSNSTREVAQDGRRGALMISIDVRHPDSHLFIKAKEDRTKITGANISVKITDEFMQAVINNKQFATSFPIGAENITYINANKLWEELIAQAHENAEPGVLFWDTAQRNSPSDLYEGYEIKGVNPCGEILLSDFECCRLASINLINFVDNPYTEDAIFRSEDFKEVVYNSQKLMDDIVMLDIQKMNKILEKLDNDRGSNYSEYNTEFDLWVQILLKTIEGHRTGLGITGLGDTLAAMGYSYSLEAVPFIDKLFKNFATASYKASIDMAENRKAFKNCNPALEVNHFYLKRIYDELPIEYKTKWEKYGRRNIANLTVAPNGSISILANVTSGIEPVFELEYKRKRKVDIKDETTTTDANGDHWKTYTVLHKGFDNYLTINNLKEDYYSNEMSKKLVLERSPYYNSTANTLNPIDKVKIQGIIQNWIDHSISVTHNLPKDITKEEVSQIYIEAWKNGCKGCTIYREGSRDGVLVRDTTKEVKHESSFKQHTAIKRPKELFCKLHPIKVDKKDYIVSVGLIENKPFEIFIFPREGEFIEQAICRKMIRGSYNIVMLNGKTIYKDIVKSSGNYGSITRLISLAFRHGAEVRFVVDQLSKDEGDFNSVFKALARVLKEYIKTGAIVTGKQCPECKQDTLIYEQGCHRCTNCGYNGCS